MSDLPQHITDFFDLLAEVTDRGVIDDYVERGFGPFDPDPAGAAEHGNASLEERSRVLSDIEVAADMVRMGEHSEESIKAANRQLRKLLAGLRSGLRTLTDGEPR